jgi:hypothetical protein
MTIEERTDKGEANYGWGVVYCDTCANGSGAHILLEIDKGEYKQEHLTPAKIELLRTAAKKHNLKTAGAHTIRTIIHAQ